MMEKYKAHFVWNENGYYVPEIVYPSPEEEEGNLPEFRLGDAAIVIITFDPEYPWQGLWEEARAWYQTEEHEWFDSFDVEVLYGVWECNPESIVRHIDELTDKIRRRNRQIEDLRHQLTSVKAR